MELLKEGFTQHVNGENRGNVLVFSLSTCGWCRKTKQSLNEMGVAYAYIDVDTLNDSEKDLVMAELSKWNKRTAFPTVIVNELDVITGYNPGILKELLGL